MLPERDSFACSTSPCERTVTPGYCRSIAAGILFPRVNAAGAVVRGMQLRVPDTASYDVHSVPRVLKHSRTQYYGPMSRAVGPRATSG